MEYGCIGEHLKHSFSKEIHNALTDYDYVIKELTPEELPVFMIEKQFKAINVTIPYKRDVIPFLDWIPPEAEEINAVNTIVNKDGKLYGYNTDFLGLKSLIERADVSLKNKTVAILGSGGTSSTAYAVAKSLGAENILRVSRNSRDGFITYSELYEKYSTCNIIINTTPCGMYPNIGESAVDLNKLPFTQAVFDAVYNPLQSKLLCDAKAKGLTAVGGLYMLVSQAAYAVEKFIDMPVDTNKVESIFQKLYKEKMNVILIGMPASGKTTVGKILSDSLNKCFVDTDDLIVEAQNKPVPVIFDEVGETGFRQIEKDIIFKTAGETSCVIATGGGAVLNKDNIDILKENGRVYFLNRPLNMLITTADRPLSSNRADLEKRYNERYSLYLDYADVVVDGGKTPQQVASIIEEDFYGYFCN